MLLWKFREIFFSVCYPLEQINAFMFDLGLVSGSNGDVNGTFQKVSIRIFMLTVKTVKKMKENGNFYVKPVFDVIELIFLV